MRLIDFTYRAATWAAVALFWFIVVALIVGVIVGLTH